LKFGDSSRFVAVSSQFLDRRIQGDELCDEWRRAAVTFVEGATL